MAMRPRRSGPTYAIFPSRTTITESSRTVSSRIALPRTPARPVGVAICARLRMRSATLLVLAMHRCDGQLVRFLLGVEHQQLLDRVERRLQFVARRAAFDFQV